MDRSHTVQGSASVILPPGHKEGIRAMLRAYFDDAGTHGGSPVVVVGGLVGTIEQWLAFEVLWAQKLAEPVPGKPRLEMFHLSHCAAKEGEFRFYSQAESDLVTHDFRRIIANCGIFSTTSAIDAKAWKELVTPELLPFSAGPVEQCLWNCLEDVLKIANGVPSGDKVAIVFDRSLERPITKQIAENYLNLPDNPTKIVSVNFGGVKDFLPLQGADMAATESYWHAQKWIEQGGSAEARAHFEDYLNTIHGYGLILGRKEIQENLDNFKATGSFLR